MAIGWRTTRRGRRCRGRARCRRRCSSSGRSSSSSSHGSSPATRTSSLTSPRAPTRHASILDLLEERQNDLGYDFAMTLDPQGKVVARTDNPDAVGEDLSQRPLIKRAQEEFEATGFWKQDKRLFNAVAVPLAADQILQGFLVAGFAIDNEDADQVRKVSGADVAILADEGGAPQVVATTLGPAEVEELLAGLQQRNMVDTVMKRGESVEQVDLQLHGGRWIGLLRPLGDASGNRVGAVVSLASLDAELLPFQRIETILLIVGGAAVLIASLFSFLLGRRVFKPVRDLANAASRRQRGQLQPEDRHRPQRRGGASRRGLQPPALRAAREAGHGDLHQRAVAHAAVVQRRQARGDGGRRHAAGGAARRRHAPLRAAEDRLRPRGHDRAAGAGPAARARGGGRPPGDDRGRLRPAPAGLLRRRQPRLPRPLGGRRDRRRARRRAQRLRRGRAAGAGDHRGRGGDRLGGVGRRPRAGGGRPAVAAARGAAARGRAGRPGAVAAALRRRSARCSPGRASSSRRSAGCSAARRRCTC